MMEGDISIPGLTEWIKNFQWKMEIFCLNKTKDNKEMNALNGGNIKLIEIFKESNLLGINFTVLQEDNDKNLN